MVSQSLSLEYLTSFHDLIKAHPAVYKHVLEEVHLKARGSAGGKKRWSQLTEDEAIALIDPGDDPNILEEPEKQNNGRFTNASPTGKVLAEDDETITVEVFPIAEGVFTGTNGVPTLKKFDEFAPYVHWLDGVPITKGHLWPEEPEVTHATYKPGKLNNTGLDPDNRRARAEGRYFKNQITPERLAQIKSGTPHDGSIEYICSLKDESGEFNGKHYDRVEVGPYYFYNYAEVPHGACTVADGCGIQANAQGCGPFQNAKKKDDFPKSDDKLILDDGKVKKCPKKQKNGEDSMSEELLKPILDRLDAIDKRIEKFENAKPPEVDFSPINSEIESLKEKFANAAKEQDAAKDAADKTAFKEKFLNAAAATEIDTIWPEVRSLSPMEFESWKQTNAGKLLTEAEKKETKGRKQTNAASGWDLAAEQAKVWGY